MASLFSLTARENVNRSLLTELVEIFQAKEFGEKFRISSLNTKDFLKWAVKADTAFQQQVVGVLKMEMQR